MKNITQPNNFGIKKSVNNDLAGSDIPSFPLLADFSISETLQLIGLLDWNTPKQSKPIPSYREIAEQLAIYPEAKEYLKQQTTHAREQLQRTELADYFIHKKSFNKGFW